MGSKETRRILKHACTGRLAIVALSAQPPGVNELCVCVCVSCVGFRPYILPRAQSIIEKHANKFDFNRLLYNLESDELSTDNMFYKYIHPHPCMASVHAL